MKFTAAILALVAVASAGSIEQKSAMTYTYEDIREQELKCKADADLLIAMRPNPRFGLTKSTPRRWSWR